MTRRRLIDAACLAAIAAATVALRAVPLWRTVFQKGWVNLIETDAWYHLRAIENLVAQFPHRLTLDPYISRIPTFVAVGPLFDWLAASLALVAGVGHPSSLQVASVTAWVAPLLAAATVLLLYAATTDTHSGAARLIPPLLAATIPGRFFERTLLGYADHHALEACLSVAIVLVVIRSLGRPEAWRQHGLGLGLVLAAYRLAWTNAEFLVLLLTLWLAAHIVLHAWRGMDLGSAHRVAGVAALVALAVAVVTRRVEPFNLGLHTASLAALLGVSLVGELLQHQVGSGRWSSPLAATGIVTVAVAIALGGLLIRPQAISGVRDVITRFSMSATTMTVTEARPLLWSDGHWVVGPVFSVFGWSFVAGVAALVMLVVSWFRTGSPMDIFLVTWTAAMYVATLGQNRFGYYLVPALALVLGRVGAPWFASRRRGIRWVAAFGLAVGLTVNGVYSLASTINFTGVPSAWYPAFAWLRSTSDEPFGDPGYYFARYESAPQAPRSTVMAWWDYGYWITALSRRVPVSNPTQGGAVVAGQFFGETDETKALALLRQEAARYVLVDELLPLWMETPTTVGGRFLAMLTWTGTASTDYVDTLLIRDGSGYREMLCFKEAYYRSMMFRLGVLGGEAWRTTAVPVITQQWQLVLGLGLRKVVTGIQTFKTVADAQIYLNTPGPGERSIVGLDPTLSPLPMEPLQSFHRVFVAAAPGRFGRGTIQIFERTDAR